MTRRFVMVVLTALLSLSAIAVAQAQREMTMQEYEARLRECQSRQRVADSTRTALEQQIAQKRAEIGSLEQQIAALARQTLDAVGAADSAVVRSYLGQLDAIVQQLQAMRQLSADQIVTARERGDIDRIDAQLTQLKANRISACLKRKPRFGRLIR